MTSALVATSVAGEAEQVLSTDNKMIAATKVNTDTMGKARSLGSCSSGAGNKKKRRRRRRRRKRRLQETTTATASASQQCTSKFDPGNAFEGVGGMNGAEMASTRDVVNPYSWAKTLDADAQEEAEIAAAAAALASASSGGADGGVERGRRGRLGRGRGRRDLGDLREDGAESGLGP